MVSEEVHGLTDIASNVGIISWETGSSYKINNISSDLSPK